MDGKFAVARELIERAQNIILVTHEEPDGDALGSISALKMALERIGKKATAFCSSPIPAVFNFLPQISQIKNRLDLPEADLIVGLDYGSVWRLGLDERYLRQARNFLTFDHHLIDDQLEFRVIESESSSTCELIYRFLKFFQWQINREIASCLLAGIFDDTGGLRYPNTTAQTLKIIGELLLLGAPLQKISQNLGQSKTDLFLGRGLWVRAFEQIQFDRQSGLIFSVIDYQSLSGRENDFRTSGILNFFNAVPGTKAALLLREKSPGCFEGSLRSQPDRGLNVAQIAWAFGGGGHKLAAGFKTKAAVPEIIEKIKNLIACAVDQNN